ncbi:hypothetical protein PIB30_004690 [Stylosanthes scabra]|uniref:Uncharacterized protein n=1 Tax=Stylosanthes scabra TaxID=79078 RepID=A0ABU6R3R2_9FABA|nr:hypothetical protein [Stylosanthes scabra]
MEETTMLKGVKVMKHLRSSCSTNGGGALGTRMNLFDRFARVVKVNRTNDMRSGSGGRQNEAEEEEKARVAAWVKMGWAERKRGG